MNVISSPIALFVYNRPAHTQKTIAALLQNKIIDNTDLFIFSDAPKSEEDIEKVKEVRRFVKEIKGVKSLEIIESNVNKGLAKSITEGVTQLVNTYGSVLVLEDDLVTSPFFLTYMNKALNIYKDSEKVMHVAAYIPPIKAKLPDTFFYNQSSCWGWGTWKRAWDLFEPDAAKLLTLVKEKNELNYFNMDNSCDFLSQLEQNVNGTLNTWAIKWQAIIHLHNGLCLHPGKSLVQNIGLDWSGVHTGSMPYYNHKVLANFLLIDKITLAESIEARYFITEFYKKNHFKKSFLKKLISHFILKFF